MDLFKFNTSSPDDASVLDLGQQINGVERTTWVERYDEPGEFTFETKLSSGLNLFLPKGTLVSHMDTLDVMIVEDHQITEKVDEDPTLKITGRSFTSWMENRIVGSLALYAGKAVTPYRLPSDISWNQAVKLINDHINPSVSPNDVLPNVVAAASVTGSGTTVDRTVEFGTVLERATEIIKVDGCGIKTIRRNNFGIGSPSQTIWLIHRGVDRSASVRFAWKSGDLTGAEYLSSQRDDKNAAVVIGQYVAVLVYPAGYNKYNRRTLLVDGKDIDGNYGSMPVDPDLTTIANTMTRLGELAIANHNKTNINQADISKTTRYVYRRDYNIGDLVTLDGNYGATEIRRVVEYAEIEDENGESGHPTLAILGT